MDVICQMLSPLAPCGQGVACIRWLGPMWSARADGRQLVARRGKV